jgi:MFS transporter, NRE family, putaive nickel resistance protein
LQLAQLSGIFFRRHRQNKKQATNSDNRSTHYVPCRLFANIAPFNTLIWLWALAGLGQSLAEIPSETLIGENIPEEEQGKVYGSHFGFSHLWWAISYPIAGWTGGKFPDTNFLYAGITVLILSMLLALFTFRNKKKHHFDLH